MNYERFFEELGTSVVDLGEQSRRTVEPDRLSNEALFHLPLIALTVLLLAGARRKPKVGELGQLVGECFERTFSGFRHSSQHLAWSANLRVRTVLALTFLEETNQITIDPINTSIACTPLGRAVLTKVKVDEYSDLTFTLAALERSYRNIGAERQLALQL